MTVTDDDLPDDVLEEQAAAEGLSPRPTRRHRGIPHDADAEEAVIGAMLYSLISWALAALLKPQA